MPGNDFNKALCDQEHKHLRDELSRIEEQTVDRIKGLQKVIEKIRDRPPVWVTILLMLMASALGYAFH